MTKSVLVFEWMVGGGIHCDSDSAKLRQPDPTSLMSEGAEMLRAIAEDFADCGLETIVPIDRRFRPPIDLPGQLVSIESEKQLWQTLHSTSKDADWILLIAPESSNRLQRLVSQLQPHAHKLLSPDAAFIELATDKTKTLDRLKAAGLKTPTGCRLDRWLAQSNLATFPMPAMLKPNDGAGSEGVRIVKDHPPVDFKIANPKSWRIEELVAGTGASISVLCSIHAQNRYFAPTRQIFSEGHWVDCQVIEDQGEVERAMSLAQKVIETLPKTNGYIGIDFLLGNCPDNDTVIEVNPRLTSSYLRLREQTDFNIAERMTDLCDRRLNVT